MHPVLLAAVWWLTALVFFCIGWYAGKRLPHEPGDRGQATGDR